MYVYIHLHIYIKKATWSVRDDRAQVADEEAQFFGTAANIGGLVLMGHYLACVWAPWPDRKELNASYRSLGLNIWVAVKELI